MRRIIGSSTAAELKYSLSDLDSMASADVEVENAVAAEMVRLLKRNLLVIEILNLLPGNITSILEGI